MTSIRNGRSPTVDERILDAAAYCVTAYGADRVTLAEIARRARVSRPTVYRRWPDTRSVLAGLLTRRITGALDAVPSRGVGREAIVERMVGVGKRLREDDVVLSVLRDAPELTMVYTAERLGTSQQVMIDTLANEIKLAQEDGSVREGEPRKLAAVCLLVGRSVVQSGQIIAPIVDTEALDVELARCLNGYLAP
ncbi:TetR/AcrR family transcriptional regulator [Mycolicibacterium sp. XJ1819]